MCDPTKWPCDLFAACTSAAHNIDQHLFSQASCPHLSSFISSNKFPLIGDAYKSRTFYDIFYHTHSHENINFAHTTLWPSHPARQLGAAVLPPPYKLFCPTNMSEPFSRLLRLTWWRLCCCPPPGSTTVGVVESGICRIYYRMDWYILDIHRIYNRMDCWFRSRDAASPSACARVSFRWSMRDDISAPRWWNAHLFFHLNLFYINCFFDTTIARTEVPSDRVKCQNVRTPNCRNVKTPRVQNVKTPKCQNVRIQKWRNVKAVNDRHVKIQKSPKVLLYRQRY